MEMDRKAPLRRVFKRIPHDKALAQLMKHDDEAYLKAPKLGAPEDDDKKVDNKALFAPKAVHKAETAETPVQNEDQAGGDEPIVEPVKTVTEPRRAKSKPADPKKAPNQGPLLDEMLKMVKDARNLGELAEAIDIITKHPRVGELTEASQNTLNAAYKSRKAELVGENDGSKPVAERRPLEAIMRTGGSPKRFESEEVWRDDILQKMGAEKGEALKQFWERNVPFITAAREDGYAAAARLFEVAHKKGLA